MSRYCVVVADAMKARLFTLEETNLPELESGPKLVERKTLVNPESSIPGREVFSDARSGVNRPSGGGSAYAFDDHRAHHLEEFEKRFARDVTAEVKRLITGGPSRVVVLAAEPRMLGFLRRGLDALPKEDVEIREMASNLVKLASGEIHDHLSKERLVPACRRPGA